MRLAYRNNGTGEVLPSPTAPAIDGTAHAEDVKKPPNRRIRPPLLFRTPIPTTSVSVDDFSIYQQREGRQALP